MQSSWKNNVGEIFERTPKEIWKGIIKMNESTIQEHKKDSTETMGEAENSTNDESEGWEPKTGGRTDFSLNYLRITG